MAFEKMSPSVKLALGVGGVSLGFGLLIGAATAPSAVAPKPETVTKTVIVTKPTTPNSCLLALTTADTVNAETIQAFDLFAKNSMAIQMGEYGASNLILNDVSDLTVLILANRQAYKNATADCRAESAQ